MEAVATKRTPKRLGPSVSNSAFRPFACQPFSVGNVSVTCHSTGNHVERRLPDPTNLHFRNPKRMLRLAFAKVCSSLVNRLVSLGAKITGMSLSFGL